jgi:hypothetical protein
VDSLQHHWRLASLPPQEQGKALEVAQQAWRDATQFQSSPLAGDVAVGLLQNGQP